MARLVLLVRWEAVVVVVGEGEEVGEEEPCDEQGRWRAEGQSQRREGVVVEGAVGVGEAARWMIDGDEARHAEEGSSCFTRPLRNRRPPTWRLLGGAEPERKSQGSRSLDIGASRPAIPDRLIPRIDHRVRCWTRLPLQEVENPCKSEKTISFA